MKLSKQQQQQKEILEEISLNLGILQNELYKVLVKDFSWEIVHDYALQLRNLEFYQKDILFDNFKIMAEAQAFLNHLKFPLESDSTLDTRQ